MEGLENALVSVLDSGANSTQGTGQGASIDTSVDMTSLEEASGDSSSQIKEQVPLNAAGEPVPTFTGFFGAFGGFGGFRASHAAVRSPADDYYFE